MADGSQVPGRVPMSKIMSGAVSAHPRALGALAAVTRRAGFLCALAAVALLPRPRDDLFDFPAVLHVTTLLPACALLAAALLGGHSPRLPQLDLVALVSLLAALAFAGGERPWSVFLLAPPLIYLAARMLANARAARPKPGGLAPRLPRAWLLTGIVVLCGVHIAWATGGALATDVGTDSVRGALNLLHGHALYGATTGSDTYGPATFEAYVPFAALAANANGAARLATLFFTLLTALLLFVLGRRVRGATAGVTLAFCWLAFPFSLYEDALGWNDSLVAAALVGTLLAMGRPAGRGALAALAGWTKLAPLALVPLLALRRGRRDAVIFATAFALTGALIFLPVFAHDTPVTFLSHTFGFQAAREPVNSIWASLQTSYGIEVAWLNTASRVLHGLVVAVAITTALLLPAARTRQDTTGVAAASAAVLILLALSLSYFSFSYILWFAPLVLVAVILGGPPASAPARRDPVTAASPRALHAVLH
jgi:hypothetical protein